MEPPPGINRLFFQCTEEGKQGIIMQVVLLPMVTSLSLTRRVQVTALELDQGYQAQQTFLKVEPGAAVSQSPRDDKQRRMSRI